MATDTWNGGGGQFTDGAGWSNGVPQKGDDVEISAPQSNVDTEAFDSGFYELNSLYIGSGAVFENSLLGISVDKFFSNDGTITLDSQSDNQSTLVLFASQACQNSGVMNISDYGNIIASVDLFTNTGVININNSVDISSDTDDTGEFISGFTLNNDGNTKLIGGGTLVLSDGDIGTVGKRDNDCILENDDNTISGSGAMLEMGLKNDADGTVDANVAGGTLVIGGGMFGSNGDIVQNAGHMEASKGGTLVFDVDVTNTGGTIEAFASSSVVLNDTTTGGRVVADGGSVFINAAIAGVTVIAESGTIKILGTVQGGTLETSTSVVMTAVGATLDGSHAAVTNRGSLSVDESVAFNNRHVYYGSNSLTLDGTIVNSGSIVLYGPHAPVTLLVASSTVTLEGGGSVSLSHGGIEATSANDTLLNMNDTISGTGFLGRGHLVLDNKGLVNAAAGDTLTFDVGTATASLNTGTLEANQGGTLDFAGGQFTNAGRLIVGAGSTAEFAKAAQVTNNAEGTLEGGQWNVGGILALSGAAIAIDAATIELAGAASVFEVGAANTKIEQSLTTIAQIGALALDRRNYTTSNALTLYGRLSLIGSTFKSGRITGGAASVINGFGTVASSVSSVGTIAASGGDLRFTAAVSAAKASIGTGATLEFDAAAAAAAAVTFATGGGKLVLGNASHFTGSIGALGKGDTIDVDHFGKGTSFSYKANAKNTGGVLTLADGSARANLTLVGSYASGGFHLTTGASGDTLIAYIAPTAKTAVARQEALVSSKEPDHLAALTQSLFEGAFGGALSAGALDLNTYLDPRGAVLTGLSGYPSGDGFAHPAHG